MNRRLISVLMFAFVVAGGASLVLYRLVIGRVSASTAPAPTSTIVVAVKNLEQGTVITAADLGTTAWPGAAPHGALVKTSDALGRGVAAPIYANEPVTESRLGQRGAGGGLTAAIPPGMRAVAIRVNEVAGVAGFVVAGTHVDVLVSGNYSDGGGRSGSNVATTLLQNVSVLSAGQDFKKDMEGKPVTVQVVNLLVSPAQAEMLSLAGSQMTMQLVLRNPLDTAITKTPGVRLSSLLSDLGAPVTPVARVSSPRAVRTTAAPVVTAAAAGPPEMPPMEIIAGNKRTEVKVQKGEAR